MEPAQRPSKILVIRFSSIGDIVLTTPILRCLKEQLNAEVHYLTKATFRDLLEPNPNIDRLWLLSADQGALIRSLRQERFDYIVDLHKNLRSWKVRLLLMRPSASFPKLNWQKWLLVNRKIDRMPKVHIVDRYFGAVQKLGVTYDGGGLDHYFPKELPEVPVDGAHFTVIAIGGAHATKRLPVKKLKELITRLEGTIVLIGGPGDEQTGKQLANSGDENVINLCGKLSIQQSTAVIAKCRVLITHDTGMMHIGAALRKPMVSVWGNTVPEFGMYPFYPDGFPQAPRMEVEGLSCRPCSKIGFEECPKGHFKCMLMQDMGQIADLTRQVSENR